MDTPKIREFEEMVSVVSELPEAYESIDDLQIKLKGFTPDEVKFLSEKYRSEFKLPDVSIKRYRTYFGIRNIWVVAMSNEYEINYSFSPSSQE